VVTAALLLHRGEPVPHDVLLQGLSGDEASPSGRNALQVQVSRLRTRLGKASERLVTSGAGYRLDVGEGELDADRFETLCARARHEQPAVAAATLAEALALWRGPALADLRYEAFAQAEIARLEELRWSALEARLEAELAVGRDADVVAELERLVAEAPLRERLIELRMRALYRAGRHVEALAVYREARRRLDVELGLEPGPSLRELEQAILGHDPSLVAIPEARPRAPAAPPTPTVGREQDLEALTLALDESRLVTLTGPGGVGKTRLAVEAARALGDRYPAGVHSAWLAPVANPFDVPLALAAAVGAMPQPGEPAERALTRRLGGDATLVLADNLEHVLGSTPLLADLLAACPQLRILATSREPLRLRGERCVPVGPLAVPDAITLFVDRARDRRPEFGLTDANAPAIEDLCAQLDCLPLALELAAGRSGLLEPQQLVVRLADALPVLEGGARDAPARQRTIRATLEWSFELLDDQERDAFIALGAFTGGAELEAAEHVTKAPLSVLDALVAKSLVRLRDGRLALLEVVRQFAAAALADSPRRDTVRRRHAECYLRLAEQLAPQVRVHGEGPALHRLERELGNLRGALQWWLDRGDGERSMRMAVALQSYWDLRNGDREGVRALDAALALDGPARERGRALCARSSMSWWDREQQRDDARAALGLADASGDLEGQCMALDLLATHATLEADFGRAAGLARRQRELADELGDPFQRALAVKRQAFAEPGLREARTFADEATVLLRRCGSFRQIRQMLMSVVMAALTEERYDAAEELAARGLRAAEEADDRLGCTGSLANAGLAALFLERMDVAEQRFCEQLAICRSERVEGWWGEAALGLAAVAAHTGDGERAAMLAGAAEAPMSQLMNEADRPVYERLRTRFIAPARAAFSEAAWTRAEAAGAALTPEEVFDLALGARAGSSAAAGAAPEPMR
jgi:predicted ATPase/DNA-binding SARP family transcriptional activator